MTFSDYMISTKRLAKNAVLYYEVSSKYKGIIYQRVGWGGGGGCIGKRGAVELVEGGSKQLYIG